MQRVHDTKTSRNLVAAAKALGRRTSDLQFQAPVAYVYNPLTYAWAVHERYIRRFGRTKKRILFVGMNPGPFGMVQTGVPFGEICAVRDWMGLRATINRPPGEHPRRPVLGFDCPRSEVSGQRLWGLFASRFGTADAFFADHFVVNYCPLAFVEASGRNRTPVELPAHESDVLFHACDEHLGRVIEVLRPEWIVGIGSFATERVRTVSGDFSVNVGQILHPSPASPAANRGWAEVATVQLVKLGVWK